VVHSPVRSVRIIRFPVPARAKELIAKIGRVEVQYIPRTMNREADALANKAIDEKIQEPEVVRVGR